MRTGILTQVHILIGLFLITSCSKNSTEVPIETGNDQLTDSTVGPFETGNRYLYSFRGIYRSESYGYQKIGECEWYIAENWIFQQYKVYRIQETFNGIEVRSDSRSHRDTTKIRNERHYNLLLTVDLTDKPFSIKLLGYPTSREETISLSSIQNSFSYDCSCNSIHYIGYTYIKGPYSVPPELPTISSSEITGITENSASFRVELTDEGFGPVTSRGVCWSTKNNPTITDYSTSDGVGIGIFVSKISGLLPTASYHARAYAVNSAGTAYGNDISFQTASPCIPLQVVRTEGVTKIGSNSTIFSGNILSDGGEKIISRGVCLSTHYNPDTSDSITVVGEGTGSFACTFPFFLKFFTIYHARAYAVNASCTGYGEDITFRLKGIDIFLTLGATNITEYGATLNGVVNPQGLSTTVVFEYGVTNEYGNSIPASQSPISGDTQGEVRVSANLTGLPVSTKQTTYYYRVKTTNAKGIVYGDIVPIHL